ncbi:MAG TPA: YceI family protein [Longimicrobiales bacterium]
MSATGTTTTTWTLDPAHSTVGFAVKHMMIATVRGSFTDIAGTVTIDGDDYTTAAVNAEIDAKSITTGNDQRDGHLRSGDFFDVENHASLAFRSTGVKALGDDELKVTGDLTIRGTTKPVTLDVTIEGTGVDPWGSERLAFTATTKIRRSEFGLTWNQALESGGVLVSDDIRITIEGALVRQ